MYWPIESSGPRLVGGHRAGMPIRIEEELLFVGDHAE
jgi:hypothetical protein